MDPVVRARVGAVLTSAVLSVPLLTACISEDPGAPPPAAVTCEAYCAEVARTCTGGNRQYRSDAECMSVCGFLELGTAGDVGRNSVGCRLQKAQTAKTPEDCLAAGPLGGGVCGARCESFCAIASKHCAATPQPPYASAADCLEACNPGPANKFREDPSGESPEGDFQGFNTVNCRTHHLILSLENDAARATHCPHAAIDSPTCKR